LAIDDFLHRNQFTQLRLAALSTRALSVARTPDQSHPPAAKIQNLLNLLQLLFQLLVPQSQRLAAGLTLENGPGRAMEDGMGTLLGSAQGLGHPAEDPAQLPHLPGYSQTEEGE